MYLQGSTAAVLPETEGNRRANEGTGEEVQRTRERTRNQTDGKFLSDKYRFRQFLHPINSTLKKLKLAI